MSRKNITSSIRKGFSYQDLWALRFCADWLLNPNSYSKLTLETVPKPVRSPSFHLEDIVLTNLNNTYSLFQIKHTQKPSTNKWTWKKLLATGRSAKSEKKSLIQKWYKSFYDSGISKNISRAALITNGIPDSDLKKYLNLKTGIINIENLNSKQPKIYASLLAQTGNDPEKLKIFFGRFQFLFSGKSLEALNQEIEEMFYKRLNATEAGLNKLRLKILSESQKEKPDPITLQGMKSICEFDSPRPLDEEFIIPEDFELFDESFHKKIISDLSSSNGGVKILYGNPGSGKSTYLSKLYKDLKRKGTTVFRHHYFISADDPDYKERLQSRRVVEAIKAEFKNNPDELGELAKKNSKEIQLNEFLKKLGETYQRKNEAFVLIVDGLDHAVRHASKEELTKFLEELSYPSANFWLVLGTQESALTLLPKLIKDKCPKQAIKQINGLSKKSVSKIIRRNRIGLNLGKNNDQIIELITGLYSLTKGNPLHLHYTLVELKGRFKNSLVTNYLLNYLKPYDHNIETYYSDLWMGLSPIAKTFCLVISSVNFFFNRQYFFDLAGNLASNPSDVSQGFDEVLHLLLIKNEKISIYHESFKIFVLGQKEYSEQKSAIKLKIKNWIKKSNYKDLKWAELKKIEYELGNPKPILAIDMDWIINSLISPRNEDQILAQLNLAAKAAVECKDFPALARITLQRMYFENNTKYSDDTYDELWAECFDQLKSDVGEFDLEDLSSEQLLSVAKKFKNIGKLKDIYKSSFEIILERCSSLRIGEKDNLSSSRPDIVDHLIQVYSLDDNHKIKYIHRIITKILRPQKWSVEYFKIYVTNLLETNQYSKIEPLLKLPLITEEKNQILDLCAEHDFLFADKRFLKMIKAKSNKNPSKYCLLYLALHKQPLPSLPSLPQYSSFPKTVPEYIADHQEGDSRLFFDNFLLGLIYQTIGNKNSIKEWVDKSDKRWPIEITSALFTSAAEFASSFGQSKKLNFSDLIQALKKIPQLKFPEDRDLIGLQRSLNIALKEIFKLIYVLNKNKNRKFVFSKYDIDALKKENYFSFFNFVDCVQSTKEPFLSTSGIECFAPSKSYKNLLPYESMSGRALNYLKLSRILKVHSRKKEAHLYLKLAGQNFMGHGYHKDTIVFDILSCIRNCRKIGTKNLESWVLKTVPIVENYSDFTDGDETNHLPNELANCLQEVNSKLLYKYYSHIANNEELFTAERIFPKILNTFTFSNEFEKAVAESAIDKDSFETLEEISRVNNDAKSVLDSVKNYFGDIKHPEDRDSTSSTVSPPKIIDYSKIEPKTFKASYEKIDSWERSNFLNAWFQYWSNRNSDKREIYNALLSAVDNSETDTFNGSLYDLLYPLALEFESELSYELLCKAQIANRGWNFYWDAKEKTLARWSFLKSHFQGRHFDFFEKTTLNYEKWLGKDESYFFPLPAGIEYLIFFDEKKIAENTTNAIAEYCDCLTADLKFLTPKWFNSEDYDPLDILFQRLLWPSPLAKERTANAISRLLLNPVAGEQVLKRLINWLENQPLISVKTMALLPIIKAFDENQSLIPKQSLNPLKKYYPSNSLVFNLLLEHLGQVKKTPTVRGLHKYFPPSSYQIDQEFLKTVKSYLPPIYYEKAEKITSQTGIDFVKSWSFIVSKLVKKFYPGRGNENVLYFMGRKNEPFMAGMSSTMSEIYRSAYLTNLHILFLLGLISDFMYHEHSFTAMPIDFSYWKITPNRAPDWWPVLEGSTEQRTDIVNISYKKNIEEMINKADDYKIIALSGPMKPVDGWANEIKNTLIVTAFFYRINGPDIPTATEIGNEIIYSPRAKLIYTKTNSPFHYLKSYDSYFFKAEELVIKDLSVYPIVALNDKTVSGIWQWFRLKPTPDFIPVPQIASDLEVNIEKNCFTLKDSNNKTIFISEDWTEGVTERQSSDLEIPHGCYLKMDKIQLDMFLSKYGLRLGYFYKFVHYEKKDRYADATQIDNYHLIGVNQIII